MGKKCVVARPIHVSNSHTKFGWISSNSLGGDIVTEGQTEAIAISPSLFFFFLKKHGDTNEISVCLCLRRLRLFDIL